jgi:hypothetical protein
MGRTAVSKNGTSVARPEKDRITVDVWLYGHLARYGRSLSPGSRELPSKGLKTAKGQSFANRKVTLKKGSRLIDLLSHFALPTEERGITFINGNLTAMPGLQPDLDQELSDGDRVAFFHLKSMWPFQYRHGAALGAGLANAAETRKGPFHQDSLEGQGKP